MFRLSLKHWIHYEIYGSYGKNWNSSAYQWNLTPFEERPQNKNDEGTQTDRHRSDWQKSNSDWRLTIEIVK